ncbi:MAG: alanyl-tRNA editing protein [Candidatus Altiarchaeota archaeon]|nr:alanyl-tRNA editing protein [Candidatus Altiarchaeota archaeon]
MTELLHMKDNYLRRFKATITEIVENGIVLDRTAFYPLGGGVNFDKGMIVADKKYNVIETKWQDGKIVHIIEDTSGLLKGQTVNGEIEWERRYKLMRNHTAAHLLESIVFDKTKALIGSGKVDTDKGYLGFTLENMDRELIQGAVDKANKLIEKGAPVKIYFMERSEALKDPNMVKLAGKLPPEVKRLRIVEIEGIEKQACGGPHIANINEIVKIEILKLKNKGKQNRRLYYTAV